MSHVSSGSHVFGSSLGFLNPDAVTVLSVRPSCSPSAGPPVAAGGLGLSSCPNELRLNILDVLVDLPQLPAFCSVSHWFTLQTLLSVHCRRHQECNMPTWRGV
jgi:hypothetical protein